MSSDKAIPEIRFLQDLSTEPTASTLAWFMLNFIVPLPKTLDAGYGDSSEDIGNLLPTRIEDLNFYSSWINISNFALQYDRIPFSPKGMFPIGIPKRVWDGSRADKLTLARFLEIHLWYPVNAAISAAEDLPYEYEPTISSSSQDMIMHLLIKESQVISGIVDIETRFSLTEAEMRLLKSQQPSVATLRNQKILRRLVNYFIETHCSWGAITNGFFTLFMRYTPTDGTLHMSELIDHTKPGLLACYCYFAYRAANDRPRHGPRRITTAAVDQDTMNDFLLDMPAFSAGNHARVYSGTDCRDFREVVVKISYGGSKSNLVMLAEIKRYKVMRDLWGNVLPEIYGAGAVKECGHDTNTYCLVLEKLDEVDWTNQQNKVLAKVALKRIHEHGIAHQDVRRENFRWRSKSGEVVIIDLGCAVEGTSEDMADDIGSVNEL